MLSTFSDVGRPLSHSLTVGEFLKTENLHQVICLTGSLMSGSQNYFYSYKFLHDLPSFETLNETQKESKVS